MLIKKIKILSIASFLFAAQFSALGFAEPLSIVGAEPFSLPSKNEHHLTATKPKTVKLIKFNFTPAIQQIILNRLEATAIKKIKATKINSVASKIYLGMNDTPVLDQGAHGTCVTFAVTAAIDAALENGDYISQLCSLELGSYLSQNGYVPSGWSGTDNLMVFEQIHQFGIVTKSYQNSFGCAGYKAYPAENPNDNGSPMNLVDFYQASEKVFNRYNGIYWFPIFSLFQPNLLDKNGDRILAEVKEALRHRERVVFGFFIDTKEPLIGKYHIENDTWLLTDSIIADVKNKMMNMKGHEEIIIGYDDNAIAYDQNGQPHQGLLTLRNSWGTNVPGQGEQYMSYDYFKAMSDEATRVITHEWVA